MAWTTLPSFTLQRAIKVATTATKRATKPLRRLSGARSCTSSWILSSASAMGVYKRYESFDPSLFFPGHSNPQKDQFLLAEESWPLCDVELRPRAAAHI